jgi:hypothetical protein
VSETVPPLPAVESTASSPADTLQFGHAEFTDASAGVTCTMCQAAVSRQYFEVNRAVVCESCCGEISRSANRGSRASRFFRALGAGLLAGAAGSGLYFLVGKLTGYEFGLVAILVGVAVGAAVKWGSYGRGGWAYQTLAVALTYLAIVTTYVPDIVQGFTAPPAEVAAAADPVEEVSIASEAERPVAAIGVNADAPVDASAEPMTLGTFLLAWLLILLIACAAPFLMGLENLLGILIIGFGLYEAWKINRRAAVTITGPHAVGAAAAATSAQ